MSYESEVLADSPVLYLRCEETSGATVANTGSLGGSATANGSYTRNVSNGGGSALGVGISFPGSAGTYVSYADNAALDITGDVTYECWIQCDNFTNLHYVMGKGRDNSTTTGYYLFVFTDRTVQVWRAGTSVLYSGGVVYPNDANWHHLAFTRAADIYKIYVDGALAATSGTVSTALQATTQAFSIGRDLAAGTPSGFHAGDIDEIAVYGAALSGARIQAHYDARNTGASTFVPQIVIVG